MFSYININVIMEINKIFLKCVKTSFNDNKMVQITPVNNGVSCGIFCLHVYLDCLDMKFSDFKI